MKLVYVGQNQDSGLYPKKSGVIFFKAKLLNPKHGVEQGKGDEKQQIYTQTDRQSKL